MIFLDKAKVHAAFKLREPLLSIEVIIQNRIWCVTTTTQKYSLKCVSHTLDSISLEQVERGNKIADAFLSHDIPAVVPIIVAEQKFLIELEGKYYLLFPWQHGEIYLDQTITAKHAFAVGKTLGLLHTTKLNLTHGIESPWQIFSKPDWCFLQREGKKNNCLWSEIFDAAMAAQLTVWTEHYQKAKTSLLSAPVISHGDLIPQNIIWTQNSTIKIIDWDSAGTIHPEVELFGVAINWAGIASGNINQELFQSVYAGYQTIAPMNSVLKPEIVWASLGSWLKWLVININRSLSQNDESSHQQVIFTLAAISRMVKSK